MQSNHADLRDGVSEKPEMRCSPESAFDGVCVKRTLNINAQMFGFGSHTIVARHMHSLFNYNGPWRSERACERFRKKKNTHVG